MKKVYVPILLHSFDNRANASIFTENTSSTRKNDDKVQVNHQYSVSFLSNSSFSCIPSWKDSLSRNIEALCNVASRKAFVLKTDHEI